MNIGVPNRLHKTMTSFGSTNTSNNENSRVGFIESVNEYLTTTCNIVHTSQPLVSKVIFYFQLNPNEFDDANIPENRNYTIFFIENMF